MLTFTSEAEYFNSCKKNSERIARIDAVIDTLLLRAAEAASNPNMVNFNEYMLNDGQTIIKSTYRSLESIQNSIMAYEKLKQMYVNRNQGRMVRLMDGRNFIGNRNGR